MRNHIQRYLNDARGEAHQRFLGADGFIDQNLYFTDDLNPGNFFMRADGGGNGNGASAQAAMAVGESQPYIFTLSNASATAVSNFNIWGADIYLRETFNADGSLTLDGVTIQSDNTDVPGGYYAALQQSKSNNFTNGKTYLSVISGPNAQAFQPLRVRTNSMNGNQATKTLPSPLPGSQFQAGVYTNNMPYRIDGYTTVGLRILASAVFQIYFYPSFDINLARGLGQAAIGRNFAAPQIDQPSIAVLK